MLPNSPHAVQAYLAVAALGAIWVGMNPAAPVAERDRQCGLVRPTVIISDAASSWNPPVGRVVLLSELGDATDPYAGPRPDLDEPCALGFSSGTTGTPKAFVHNRRAVSLTAAVYAQQAQLHSDDNVGIILPLSIHNLMVVGVLPALFAGATVIPVQRMSALGVAAACAEHRLTTLTALVPATVYDLVHDDRIAPESLATLRYAGTGAANLTEKLRFDFERKFGIALVGSYGMTEAPGVVCTEDPDEAHRPGGSGRPLPHVEVEASDDTGRIMVARQEGELIVRPSRSGRWAGHYAPSVGMWTVDGLVMRDPGDRVLRTGDYGWVDYDGAVFVTGRKADVIIRGGVNVNAAELESILGRLPQVRDIAVIGADDDRLGQRIVAHVEPTAGGSLDPELLRAQARSVLAHGKVPDEFVVHTLPRNAMGKVARAELNR